LSPLDCFVMDHFYRPFDDNVRHFYTLKIVLLLSTLYTVLPQISSSVPLYTTVLCIASIAFYEICRFHLRIDALERELAEIS